MDALAMFLPWLGALALGAAIVEAYERRQRRKRGAQIRALMNVRRRCDALAGVRLDADRPNY